MDFNHLNVFIQVYITKSFSGAAKNLYLTQPTISAHIQQLEKELNTKLFNRTTKNVEPTEAGELLYDFATELIEKREKIIDFFATKFGNYETLNFGSSTIPTNYILPSFMAGFIKYYNNVKYNQIIGDTFEIIEKIKEKIINIGFVGNKVESKNIEFIPFFVDSLVFVTPNTPHYKKIIRSKNPIHNLLKCPIILRKNTSGTKKKGDDFLNKLGYSESDLDIIGRINEQEKIYKMVSSGSGISLFSKVAAKTYKDEGRILVYNPVSYPMRRNLYIAINKDVKLKAIEKKFIDFILSH